MYIANNYTVRVQTYSRANVSSEGSLTVDAKGYPISKWKTYNCICGGCGDDNTNLCPVKFMYKYVDEKYHVCQSDGVHASACSSIDSRPKRKLSELPDGVQNVIVSMVCSGSQPANIVNAMRHSTLDQQREIFPDDIFTVISTE